MHYLFFDLIIVALLLFAVWRGYRTGFILTFCSFLAVFVALLGASLVSNSLAQPVSHAISPMIESSIQQVMERREDTPPQVQSSEQEELSELPPDTPMEEILDLLKQSPLYRGFADALQAAVDAGLVAATVNASKVIAEYIAGQLARMVLFAVSFILILILWFFISHALDLAFKLPVLSTLNRWGGAALGLFKGSLMLFILCWLFKGSFLPQDAIQNTYLLHFFCTASPLSLLP